MISTPIKPTPVAIQRRMPTRSPRKNIDNAVTNSGATNPVADASAMGRNCKPEMKHSEDASSAVPRIKCSPRLSDCKAYKRVPGNIAGTMISANTENLIQAISIDGKVDDRYFDVTSELARNTVDASIKAMPRNGRSARAGAAWTVAFFPGKGKGALSSLAAAADGGVTVKLNCGKLSNRVSAQKTIIARYLQGPKTGSRYA